MIILLIIYIKAYCKAVTKISMERRRVSEDSVAVVAPPDRLSVGFFVEVVVFSAVVVVSRERSAVSQIVPGYGDCTADFADP